MWTGGTTTSSCSICSSACLVLCFVGRECGTDEAGQSCLKRGRPWGYLLCCPLSLRWQPMNSDLCPIKKKKKAITFYNSTIRAPSTCLCLFSLISTTFLKTQLVLRKDQPRPLLSETRLEKQALRPANRERCNPGTQLLTALSARCWIPIFWWWDDRTPDGAIYPEAPLPRIQNAKFRTTEQEMSSVLPWCNHTHAVKLSCLHV